MIKVKHRGQSLLVQQNSTILDIYKQLDSVLKHPTSALLDGQLNDLRSAITKDCEIEFLTFEDPLGKEAFFHTTSHILAQAVKRLYKNAKLAIGPAIEKGFYYDFEVDTPFTENDLAAIEAEMKVIVKEALPIETFLLTRQEAIAYFKDENEPYKIELINDLPEDASIRFYKQGEFIDLCAGPHLLNTKYVKAIRLLSVAGAYWRGSEKNKMLSRIYGVSFPKVSQLEEYLTILEETKKRDHRKIGKELELFALMDEAPGFPFFLPHGMIIRNELIDYWKKKHKEAGYLEVNTPIILNQSLWERSGHWVHFKENMYTSVIDNMEVAIKPMNCPGGILVYKQKLHSYKEFPLRLAELGLVHRHELSGALSGLMRVRGFVQDDAHIFMTPKQIKDEIIHVIELTHEIYKAFGFTYEVKLSTRPESSMGSDEEWQMATDALKNALEEMNIPYTINEGDGAFYGPKIDYDIRDCLDRTWQCGTIQLDFQQPINFDLEYIDIDGQKKRPVMIHRTIYGSLERFMGILIEHFAGQFPLWLSPVQVKILPISEKFHDYAKTIAKELEKHEIRHEIDERAEKIGFKIREARNKKIPYLFIVGEKEEKDKKVSVRSRKLEDEGQKELKEMIDRLLQEINEKEL